MVTWREHIRSLLKEVTNLLESIVCILLNLYNEGKYIKGDLESNTHRCDVTTQSQQSTRARIQESYLIVWVNLDRIL